MGHEIVYCAMCGGQVRGADFESSKAVRIATDAYCPKCAKEVLATLSPEEARRVLEESRPAEPLSPPSGGRKTRSSGTARVVRDGGPTVALIGVALVAVVAIGIAAVLAGTRRPPPPEAPPPKAPVVIALPVAPPAVVRTDPDTSAQQKKEASARSALDQARDYARRRPEDLEGQLGRFEQAAWSAKDTPIDFDARKERAAALTQLRAGISAELIAVDGLLKAALEREAFRAALQDLEEARKRFASTEWTSAVDQKTREVHDLAHRLFGPLREKAIEARRRGSEEDLTRIEERLARWGLEDRSAELSRSLAEVPNVPALPVVPPEIAAYRGAWESALALAELRDGSGGARALETAAGALQGELKAEAAADLELFRLLGSLHDELKQILPKLPKGQKLALAWLDDEGKPAQAAGSLLRTEAGRIELKKDDQVVGLLIGEILPSTWADLYRNRSSRKPAQDERGIALFLLVEGDSAITAAIRSKPELRIPEKYLAWAVRRRAARALPEAIAVEKQARRSFAAAEHELLLPATRALGALRCRELLENSKDARFVAHNRAALAARADAGKDHVFLADDLSASGNFRLSASKTGSSWTADGEVEPARKKENSLDIRFSVLPGAEYRAWVQAGGCCAEGLTFAVQGTQMTMPAADAPVGVETGGDVSLPVKSSIAAVSKTHPAHGGKRPPLRWGWIEIALPKYREPGTKILRLLGDQPGFSVSAAVVSSIRQGPPAEAELKELQKARSIETDGAAGRTAKLVPLSGLAAWYRADQGVVMNGATVSEWKDQSAYGRYALQTTAGNQPAVAAGACNGKPALVFDGNAKNLLANIPVNGLGGLTVILVSACEQDSDAMPNCSPLKWGETAGWGTTHLTPRRSGVVFMFGTGQESYVNYPRPTPQPGFTLTTARKDGPAEFLYVNGLQVWTATGRAPALQGTSPAAAVGGDFNGSYFNGKLAEVMVYERALSEAERQRVEQYLKLKYRIN